MAELDGHILDLHLAPEGDPWFEIGKREKQHDPVVYSTGIVGEAGGASDSTPPTIINITPPPGSQLPTKSTPVGFDVVDLAPGLQLVLVTIKYANRPETQVVYNGVGFVAPFNTAGSSVTPISQGLRFLVSPGGEWLGDISELFVYAIDSAGNLEGLP